MRIHAILFSAVLLLSATLAKAGEPVKSDSLFSRKKVMAYAEIKKPSFPVNIFNSTRVISGHATDMLNGRELDIRITHRFGDMATPGAWHGAFGLDNSTDIRIAFEYGITSKLNIGLGRSKGSGPQTEVWDGYGKYAIIKQNEDKSVPLSITLLGAMTTTSMVASPDSSSPVSFQKFAHRMSYVSQLLIAKKFGSRVSFQLMPTYVHRNYVAFDDKNGIFAVGAALRLRVTKVFSLLTEYYQVLPNNREVNGTKYYNPLGLGFEFDTGGHLFMVNFTNSAGINETLFIPYTASNLAKGQFRIGFTISRIMKL
jgi:hypothetical protein